MKTYPKAGLSSVLVISISQMPIIDMTMPITVANNSIIVHPVTIEKLMLRGRRLSHGQHQ